MHRWSIGAAGLVVACLVLSATASADEWTLQTPPPPAVAGATATNLFDVSCDPGGTTACTAVGKSTTGGADASTAARWNGNAWALQTVATPSGAQQHQLYGVTCTSSSSCVAVGHYRTTTSDRSLAEIWNGTSWTVQATPNPAGATFSQLSGVACSAANACSAVGYSTSGSGTAAMVQRWNGTAWALQAVPVPAGAAASQLDGVACPSTSFCMAVGRYTDSAGVIHGLTASWNGTAWTSRSIVEPAGTVETTLVDVTCSAATECVAVGGRRSTASLAQATFVQRWNGASWSFQSTPNVFNSSDNVLRDISCATASACIAVGSWVGSVSGNPHKTLVMTWDGTQWTITPTSNPASARFSSFYGSSCRSDHCVAVGTHTSSSGSDLALTGIRTPGWTTEPTQNVAGALSNYLWEVACVPGNADSCTAVGSSSPSLSAGSESLFVQRWNGTGWAIQAAAPPAGALRAQFRGVSCRSTTSCIAVGQYTSAARVTMTLAETWNGTAWNVQSTPNPAGATSSQLTRVSCSATNACTAVGHAVISGVTTAIAERWNGTAWSLQTVPAPAGARSSQLSGVSCSSATACIAVGQYTDSAGVVQGLSAVWDGTAWTPGTVPPPSGGRQLVLDDISCARGQECMAVGQYVDAFSSFQPAAIRWNGATWSNQAVAQPPAGSIFERLRNVSCSWTTSCSAVGYWTDSAGVEHTLAQAWDAGVWTVQPTPSPLNASTSDLQAVVCPASLRCHAVGYSIDSTDPQFTRTTLGLRFGL